MTTPTQQQIADEWAQIRQMEVFKLLLAGPEEAEARATEDLIKAPDIAQESGKFKCDIENDCRIRIQAARELIVWMNNGEAIYNHLAGPTEPDDLTE